MELPKSLTTVTSTSKIIAASIFVILPFVAFFLGYVIPKPSTVIENVPYTIVSNTVVPSTSVSTTITPTTTPTVKNSTPITSSLTKDITFDGNVITFNKPTTDGAAGTIYYTFPVKFKNNSKTNVQVNALDFRLKGLNNGATKFLNYYGMTIDGTACDFAKGKIAECMINAGTTGVIQLVFAVSNVDPQRLTQLNWYLLQAWQRKIRLR